MNTIFWPAAKMTAANTAKDGTGTVTSLLDGYEGGWIERLVFRPAGTNVASVARCFVNNGQSNALAANNVLHSEVTLPATSLSEVAAQTGVILPLQFYLPPGYRILLTLGTAVAAGHYVSLLTGNGYR